MKNGKWKEVLSSDVIDIRDGTHDTPKYIPEGVPLITSKNLSPDGIDFSNISFISEDDHNAISKRSKVDKGDIIYGMIGTIGRPTIVDTDRDFSIKNVGLFKFSNSPYYNRFFKYILESSIIQRQINTATRGGTQKFVSLKVLRNLKVPLPPLSEQKRLAAILDKAGALREKRRQAIAKLNELLQSVFLDMFGDPVTNPKGWYDTAKLGEVAEIVSGITKGRKLNGSKTREIPFMAVVNVQDRHLNLDVIKTIDATEKEIQRYRLIENDLLLTEGGDPDKLGRGTLWKNELPESIHQNHIFRVRLTTEKLDPVYLNWLIGSARGKRYFLRSAKQTTGIASINMTQLRGFPLLIPPLDVQKQFVSRIKSLEKHKDRMRSHLSFFDTLFASLQQRAFKGEL